MKARHGEEMCSDHTLEMTEENVLLQLRHLETHPSVASKLTTGKAWSKFERASLYECGLLDKDEQMTEEGKEFFQEGVASGR